MSGPITVVVTTNPVVALLSAAAIQAAEALRAGYANADNLAARHDASQSDNRNLQQSAIRQSEELTTASIEALGQRFEVLRHLADQLGVGDQLENMWPAPPHDDDPQARAAYATELMALADQAESILRAAAESSREVHERFPDELALPESRKNLAQRLIERIAPLGEIPQDIANLARKLEATLPGQQAELLATELRRAVQLHLDADEKKRVQHATTIIVEQTLKDLGYEVEDIGETLFVEGGVMHFQRAGWGEYMIRLRVDANANTVNFNVIRAVEAGNNERSMLDHLAEDRWCAEFPALLRALEARGVNFEVTRRLDAGELPVQLVERDRLPKFNIEEDGRPRAQFKTREIK